MSNLNDSRILNIKDIMKIFSFIFSFFFFITAEASDLVWYNGADNIRYSLATQHSLVVNTAVDMFRGDMCSVTGKLPQVAPKNDAIIIVYQLDMASDKEKADMKKHNIPIDKLVGKNDAFYIKVLDNKIYITGSNGRGTAYGLLELSRMAGVSPWVWWGDVKSEYKTSLTISSDFETLQIPSVDYRGIFINDEDWSMRPWSCNTFEPYDKQGTIGSGTYKQIFKLLLRLRANTIWPAMHPGTVPFFMTKGAKEVADSCGIIVGSSHCEPLLRNNVGEWNVALRGHYNLISNRDSVLAYWAERLKETNRGDYLYTIGMRGIHDGSMEGVNTLKEKTDGLQAAIDAQRMLIARYVNKDVKKVPQVFVPYKEVLQIMENGLKVSDDVTLMWCDDNYGYLTRLSDSLQQQRSGGAGIYYHLSYWGRPHDYLWFTTTQPGLIYNEMRQAYDHNARKLWIANVHDPKIAAYDLELFLDMAWNINSVSASTLQSHLCNWLCRQFGDEAGKRLLPVMKEYYRLCGIRRPEFMGWSQTELDKKIYPKGLSPMADTDFNQNEFGNELNRYLCSYQKLKIAVADMKSLIRPDLYDAYFAAIQYPVYSAADMSEKTLEAQKSRAYSQDSLSVNSRIDMIKSAVKSIKAYNEIQSLTSYYNNIMSGGKWKYLMSEKPRELPVFGPPSLPIIPNESEMRQYDDNDKYTFVSDSLSTDYISENAFHYTVADPGAKPVQMLGHSMNAVSLPKGCELSYYFVCKREGEAVLRTALIPTHPNDKGDIRFSVSIDGAAPHIYSIKEADRSEQWKLNVLRGQVVISTNVSLNKGPHTLRIKSLDDHIVVDQWMIDFNTSRKFYMFP
jgi:hypothetical protein